MKRTEGTVRERQGDRGGKITGVEGNIEERKQRVKVKTECGVKIAEGKIGRI
jgi:hypothetical protein